MSALQVQGAQDMPLVTVPRPHPGAGEVLISVAYCGICGSDFPRYFDGAVHAFPQTLGHEFSGVVAELGAGVDEMEVGQRVVVAPLVPCHDCAQCRAGRPALCTGYSFIGSRQQGALAEFVTAPARNVLPLPANVSLRDAALIEPLSVALHGIALARYDRVERVAVFGAGVIGLLTVMALKAQGVPHVAAIDVQTDKLELAARLGADATVLGGQVDEYFADAPAPQVCIETAGHPVTQVQAVRNSAVDGQVVFVGTCTREVRFGAEDFERILRGELTLRGAWMSYSAPFPGWEWTRAIELIESGAIDAAAVISDIYSLDDAARPFTDVRESGGRLLKVLYRIGANTEGRR